MTYAKKSMATVNHLLYST